MQAKAARLVVAEWLTIQALKCLRVLDWRVRQTGVLLVYHTERGGEREHSVTQFFNPGKRHLKRKVTAALSTDLSRVILRRLIQKHRRDSERKREGKGRRTRYIRLGERRRTSQARSQNKTKTNMKIATWSTRGWGARYSEIDQAVKRRCILGVMQHRGVGLAVLTDVKFAEVGVRRFPTEIQDWTLVVAGISF